MFHWCSWPGECKYRASPDDRCLPEPLVAKAWRARVDSTISTSLGSTSTTTRGTALGQPARINRSPRACGCYL
eukprot:scaffold232997_cov33-Tisochrysis_lutea.AAC.2